MQKHIATGRNARCALRAELLTALTAMAACAAPPVQTTSTTTEETTSSAAGPTVSPTTGNLQPAGPGTTTTTGSYSQTQQPAQ